MSPLHINMTNVFHTGRPRGSITTPTAVTNGARPVAMPRGMKDGFRKLKRIFSTYLGFVGPGILISIAYMDPGNYSTDVAAGAQFQYKLLCIILMSNIFACFLQSLACKLGSVTGKDLAQNCRQFLPNWLRWPLYILSELAIISTDLAEIIGGAIALNLLFGLNIVAGVVLTALDVFIILLLYRPNGTLRGIRWFEMGVSILVLGVVICFSVELAKTPNIDGKQVMKGFIPSGVIFTPDGIFASLGILGATIMPHALFLGSHVTLPRVREFDRQHHPERILQNTLGEEYKWQPSISAIRATLSYSISELVISLSTFAMFVNSAILIVAGTALYNTSNPGGEDLFSIHELLSTTLAPVAGTLFALALLFSGQSSSIIATIVGQIICEGFIDWRVRPWVRRGITRLIALVPCIIVAGAIGKDGLSMALNISQVSLSILLPFVTAPLIYLTCSKKVMRVAVYTERDTRSGATSDKRTVTGNVSATGMGGASATGVGSSSGMVMETTETARTTDAKITEAATIDVGATTVESAREGPRDVEVQDVEWIDMANGWIVGTIGWLIWGFITGLNVYLIVMLGLGRG